MRRLLICVIFVLGNLGNTLRLPSTEKMLQNLEQRLDAKISNIDDQLSNLKDQIKLENEQLRAHISLIFENLIDFENKIKLLLTQQNDEDQDVGRLEGKSNNDFRDNDDRFKRMDARMDEFETALNTEKSLKQEFMATVKTINTAVSLMSDDIGEIKDNLKLVKQFQESVEELKAGQSEGQHYFVENEKNIIEIKEKFRSMEQMFEEKLDDTSYAIENLTNLNSEKFKEMNKSTREVLSQYLARENNERAENLNLNNHLAHMQSLLNETINTCLQSTADVESTSQTTTVRTTMETTSTSVHSSCRDGVTESGVYKIQLPDFPIFEAYCDMDTDGGSWLVFQRRKDGSVDFYRNWEEYKRGFGNLSGEFWLGNDIIHKLTSTPQELRIDLLDWDGSTAYAKYGTFSIGPESDKYRLHVSGYAGNAGNSLSYHNNGLFSTRERDSSAFGKCAAQIQGAWWYTNCAYASLNGHYYSQARHSDDNHAGLLWYYWHNRWHYSLKGTEMKMRPK